MSDRQKRIFEFLPLSIHLETKGGLATPLVLRGTPLPTQRSQRFSTAADNQSSVEISVLMGESPLAARNVNVGKFHLRDIPQKPLGSTEIRIVFAVDATCAVTVSASVSGTPLKAEQRFDPPIEMSDDEIRRIIDDADKSRVEDQETVRRAEAINQAQTLLVQSEGRLAMIPDERLNRAVAELGLAIQSGDSEAIRVQTDALRKQLEATSVDFSNTLFGGMPGFADLFRPPPRRVSRPAAKPHGPAPRTGAPASEQPPPTPLPSAAVATAADVVTRGRIFGGGEFTLDPRLCFVLMPFAAKFQPVYEDHVRPTVETAGFRCQRADEISGTGLITWDVWERINRARFLIAELTDQNPNVFYELGLAHALSKDVVLLTQSMDFVPFDLKALRCVVYEFTPRGMRALEARLRELIESITRV